MELTDNFREAQDPKTIRRLESEEAKTCGKREPSIRYNDSWNLRNPLPGRPDTRAR